MIPEYINREFTNFHLEKVERSSDRNGNFVVSFQTVVGPNRLVLIVEAAQLLDFAAFQVEAFRQKGVLLRHITEIDSGDDNREWLADVEMAIAHDNGEPIARISQKPRQPWLQARLLESG